jgi:hypothetical protein
MTKRAAEQPMTTTRVRIFVAGVLVAEEEVAGTLLPPTSTKKGK